jgi:uncharacterized protein (TIGR03435 family)
MVRINWITILAAACGLARGQSAPPPAFEVASVKPAPMKSNLPVPGMYLMRGGPGGPDPGQFTCSQAPMSAILWVAFDARNYQISAPAWVENEKYEILAKVPLGFTREEFRLMLQGLLAERFGMQFHRETRQLAGYEMVVAKGGVRMTKVEGELGPDPPQVAGGRGARGGRGSLRRIEDKNGLPELPPGQNLRAVFPLPDGRRRISARMQTIEDIRSMASSQSGRPVLDKTGLMGRYDFNLDIEGRVAELSATTDDAMPAATLFSVMAEQLGLKLEAKKIPSEVVVIDRLEKTPTGN